MGAKWALAASAATNDSVSVASSNRCHWLCIGVRVAILGAPFRPAPHSSKSAEERLESRRKQTNKRANERTSECQTRNNYKNCPIYNVAVGMRWKRRARQWLDEWPQFSTKSAIYLFARAPLNGSVRETLVSGGGGRVQTRFRPELGPSRQSEPVPCDAKARLHSASIGQGAIGQVR